MPESEERDERSDSGFLNLEPLMTMIFGAALVEANRHIGEAGTKMSDESLSEALSRGSAYGFQQAVEVLNRQLESIGTTVQRLR